MNKVVILLVDDEKSILKALNRTLFEYPYQIITASSSAEAKKYLSENRVDLIISDYRMPEENGFELLSFVRDNHPDTIRIMLSGYVEKKVIFESMFSWAALTYFPKPWNDEKLLGRITELLEIKKNIDNTDLWKRLNTGGLFNISSTVVNELLALNKTNPDRDHLHKIISKDLYMFFRVARIVKSDYFESSSDFDLEEAISLVGADSILELVKRIPETSICKPDLYLHMPDIISSHYDAVLDALKETEKIEPPDFYLPFISLYNYLLLLIDKECYFDQIKMLIEDGTPIPSFSSVRKMYKTILCLCKFPSQFLELCEIPETDDSHRFSAARKLRDLIELFWWSNSMPENHPFYTLPRDILEKIYEDVRRLKRLQP